MGKTRDLSKEIGNTKGTFHAKTGTVKDRNSKDLTEAEEIRWQEYTEELYKKAHQWLLLFPPFSGAGHPHPTFPPSLGRSQGKRYLNSSLQD